MARQRVFTGQAVAPGIAVAETFLLKYESRSIERVPIHDKMVDNEHRRLDLAIAHARRDIRRHRTKALKTLGEVVARIFDAHLVILEDQPTFDQIRDLVKSDRVQVEYALWSVMDNIYRSLSAQKEAIFRDRAIDVRDVYQRLLGHLTDQPADAVIGVEKPSILVAHELHPADILQLDPDFIIGVATDVGGSTSHTAILTRILGVPSVVGLREITSHAKTGDRIVINGNSGKVILRPSQGQLEHYVEKEKIYRKYVQSLKDIHSLPAETKDGHRVKIAANIELPVEARKVKQFGGDGIGLFRSEYLFLAKRAIPTEKEQCVEYERVAEMLAPDPVIIRTFDIGGDKAFPGISIPPENNPFLGWRAIRVGLTHQEILLDQLRAMFRANKHGNIWIMFPMVSDLQELLKLKRLAKKARETLRQEGVRVNGSVKLGIMVEIPSVAIQADLFAKHVDFFSIGTNDLVQFTLAVDRTNEQVSSYYQPFHPAVLHLVEQTVQAGHAYKIPVGICGEFAGDPLATLLLVGMGVDELSVSPAMIPEIKKLIRSSTRIESQELARKIMACKSGNEAYDKILRHMKKRFADLPIWFGHK